MSKTPELDKILAVREKSQIIGEFLDTAREEGVELCEAEETARGERWYPMKNSVEQMLARYFDIDLEKCEKERVALLEEIRSKNT